MTSVDHRVSSAIDIREMPADCDVARELMGELSDILRSITGRGGENHFDAHDTEGPRSAFLVAFVGDEAVGCGALRRVDDGTAEVKRLYARTSDMGVGSAVLEGLEDRGRAFGYRRLILETGRQNVRAVEFYHGHGYDDTPNFGVYEGNPASVCFSKELGRA
jgi:GNAT superfamily N-acetyltransferase